MRRNRNKTSIHLWDHFTYKRLLRFTLPSMVMMVFTSVYGVVDGFFVSNFVGKTPFAAVNFIMPLLMILGCAGFMFGTGGSALIAKTMGEGKAKKANELFSLIVYSGLVSGILIMVFGLVLLKPAAILMGAEGRLLEDSILYGKIILAATPFYILQYEFQCLFATAGKPQMGLCVTMASGITNMVLDGVFVAVFSWGLAGAAWATALSQFVGGVAPLISFLRTLVFQSGAVLLFPLVWGLEGIWMSIVAAEVLAAGVMALFLGGKRRVYHY